MNPIRPSVTVLKPMTHDSSNNPNLTHLPAQLTVLWLIGTLLLIELSIWKTDGQLFYTLDDPYIHLAVAENILRGGYGINEGEYSSPSSSAIYPFLLSLTEACGLGLWGPLLINLLAMSMAVNLVGRIIRDHVLSTSVKSESPHSWAYLPYILGLLICLAMNAWALVMMGMEHSLQVLTVIMTAWGFLELIDNRQNATPWLIVAIAIMPLIRFEGLALTLVSILLLLWLGHYRIASLSGSLALLGILFWFIFTHTLGLPLLPSSVLLKAETAATVLDDQGSFKLVDKVASNITENLSIFNGTQLLCFLLVLATFGFAILWNGRLSQKATTLLIMTLATGLAHLCFGRFASFMRYEAYVFGLACLTMAILLRSYLNSDIVRLGSIILLSMVAFPHIFAIKVTPVASRGVYLQQYQMHRFVTEFWKDAVGVNDLGWVSYRNPFFVLDLWGLGSEEVRKLRLRGLMNRQSLESITARRNVHLFLIYEDWFTEKIPSSWQKVATLKTPKVTASRDSVSFYVSPDGNIPKIKALLSSFSATIPDEDTLTIEPK